jgi:seryl-tRNA synthetase
MRYVKGILAGCALLFIVVMVWAAVTLVRAVREVQQEVAEIKASTRELGAKIAEASQAMNRSIATAKAQLGTKVAEAKAEIREQTAQAREFMSHQTTQAQASLHRQAERLQQWTTYLCEQARGHWYAPPWCKELEDMPADS